MPRCDQRQFEPHPKEGTGRTCTLCGRGAGARLHKVRYVNVRQANFRIDPDYEYGMGSKEANVYVHRMLSVVLSQMHMGTITRDELDKQVRLGLAYVVTAGYTQTLTHEPLKAVQAVVNAALPPDWEPLLLLEDWGL